MGRIWNLEQYEDNVAIIDEFGTRLTYKELNASANDFARAVGRRCLVFSLCRNVIGSVIGFVGLVNNGIVPVQLSTHLDDVLLQKLLITYKPAFIWIPKDQIERFPKMAKAYSATEKSNEQDASALLSGIIS